MVSLEYDSGIIYTTTFLATRGNIQYAGPIILYYTRTSGHVSKVLLRIVGRGRLLSFYTSKRNVLYC